MDALPEIEPLYLSDKVIANACRMALLDQKIAELADVELIRLCDEFIGLDRQSVAIHDSYGDEDTPDDEPRLLALDRQMRELAIRFCAIPARTEAGRLAKARAGKAYAFGIDHEPVENAMLSLHISASVMRDLIGRAGDPVATNPNPDAELIRLCADHIKNYEAVNRYGDSENENDPYWLAYERTREAVGRAKATRLAGVMAKCRAAKIEVARCHGEEELFMDETAPTWAWSIVNDLLRVMGGAA